MVRPSARRDAPALRCPAIVADTMPVTRRRYATGIRTDFKSAQRAVKFGNSVSKLFMRYRSGNLAGDVTRFSLLFVIVAGDDGRRWSSFRAESTATTIVRTTNPAAATMISFLITD